MSSTVTSFTAAMLTSTPDLGHTLALVSVLAFLVLLIQKEITSATLGKRSHNLARGLNIGLVPLGLAFLIIAGFQVMQVLH